MFKVTIKRIIYDGSNLDESKNWILAFHKIELPYTPFIGLKIQTLPVPFLHEIIDISWLIDENCFVCDLEAIFSNVGVDEFSFEEYASEYQ